MLYTIDQVNPILLNTVGFKIGAHILDDCDKDTYGLEQAVAFIKGKLIIKRFSLRALCYPIRI